MKKKGTSEKQVSTSSLISETFVYTRTAPPKLGISAKQKSQASITEHLRLVGIPVELDTTTETKTWLFPEWFIPPLGSGRTIIDLWPQPKLVLVRTVTVNGERVLYISIETNIKVWNPWQGVGPELSATILDVGKQYLFGSFPSGCGVNTWFVKTVEEQDDIFDKAQSAQLNMSNFSYRHC